MNYFKYFPTTFYSFGDEASSTVFRNLSVFAEIMDNVRDAVTLYENYYIQNGERPDQVSYKLYRNPTYHWTFFLVNDNIRYSGWPTSNLELDRILLHEYNHTTITVSSPLYDRMIIGQTIRGLQSGTTATIVHRNINLGQLIIETDVTSNFILGETISSENADGDTESAVISGIAPEYLAPHHYEDADNNWVDIINSEGVASPGAFDLPISPSDMYYTKNEELRSIRVLREDTLIPVVNEFKAAIGNVI